MRAILATTEDAAEATDSVAAEAPAVAQATSTTDSLAAALKGESKTQAADLEQIKKEHPLLAVLQVNPSGQGPVVGYANYKDTADINKYLSMPEIQAEMPKDLRLKWGVSPFEYDPKAQTFELYAIKSTERNGRAPLEGDVVVNAKDEFDHYGKPAVSMSMNTDGARRWAQLTKQNVGKAIAIVLDGYVYSAPNVNQEITGGNSQITGHFTPEQAKDLANVLKSGKMPAPAHIVQGRHRRSVFGTGIHQRRYHVIRCGIDSVDDLHVLHVRFHPGYGCQRCSDIELVLHTGYPLILPGRSDDVRYCRYGTVARYGCGCQRIDLRTYQRRVACR